MKRVGVVLILILALAGLANALYLAQHEKNGTPLICNVENLSGCNIVAASQYSRLFGVSLGEYGVLFYGILFVLAALELVLFDRILRRILQGVSLIGILASLYFTSLQLFIIGAFCIYCTASALITLFVFILASFLEPIRSKANTSPPPRVPPPVFPSRLPMPPASPASGLPKGSDIP